MLRSISKQSGESVESVLKKKKNAASAFGQNRIMRCFSDWLDVSRQMS